MKVGGIKMLARVMVHSEQMAGRNFGQDARDNLDEVKIWWRGRTA